MILVKEFLFFLVLVILVKEIKFFCPVNRLINLIWSELSCLRVWFIKGHLARF